MDRINPTALIFWAILGCVGYLIGRDAPTTVGFVLGGMLLSVLMQVISR